MPFYLRTWELTDDCQPHSPTVYTPDMVLASQLSHELTLIGPCALWGRVPKMHHCDPYARGERHIAVEMWGQIVTSPADLACNAAHPKVWSYTVFPRLALKQPEIAPWDEDTSPHTWTDPENPEPDPEEPPPPPLPGMPAAVYSIRRGHAWGSGPHPVNLGADGEPDPGAFHLEPYHRQLQAIVTMPPEQALAYTPDATWQPKENRDGRP